MPAPEVTWVCLKQCFYGRNNGACERSHPREFILIAQETVLYKPRILAVTHDLGFVRQVRLEMPLLSLYRQGLIDSYMISDPFLSNVPATYRFDVIWLLRVTQGDFIDRVMDISAGSYLYDIDDLIIGNPGYLDTMQGQQEVLRALANCRTITAPSKRLITLLEKYSSHDLESKSVICPNGFEFPSTLRPPTRPEGLIWTVNDNIPLLVSRDDVIRGVASFANKHSLTLFWFGRHIPHISNAFNKFLPFGYVEYWQYNCLLASLPTLLGVAPLETQADDDTLDFISGKSDIKLVNYCGHGHPSVFSNAPPYIDSDLADSGSIVTNDSASWHDGLEYLYTEGWHTFPDKQQRIVRLRNMSRIACKWNGAVERSRLDHTLTAGTLKQVVKPSLYLRIGRRLYDQIFQSNSKKP
jgi:hypothetical protein